MSIFEIYKQEKETEYNLLKRIKSTGYPFIHQFYSKGKLHNKWRGQITINKITYITKLCKTDLDAFIELRDILKNKNLINYLEVFDKCG